MPGQGPPTAERRPHEGSGSSASGLARPHQNDTARRQPEAPCAFDYLRREHLGREWQLRTTLADAVRRGHEGDQRLLLARLDQLYTARAFLRAEDREVKRYRRLLREAS